MHAHLRGPSNLLILHQIINRTWFDEIAEQRPDMIIKVTAFTVSESLLIPGQAILVRKVNIHAYSMYSLTFRLL